MSFTPTERWSDRSYTPQQSATRAFDAPGYSTLTQAIGAVVGTFGLRVGTPHPDDQFMFVGLGSLSARNNGGPTTWIVTCNYTYLVQQPQQDSANPLERATRWEITPGLESVTIDSDFYGNPITNSAGQPYEPKATRTINTLEIAAYRFYPKYVIDIALQYMNKVNNSSVRIAGLGTLNPGKFKCTLIAPTGQIISTQTSPIEVVHRFQVRSNLVSGQVGDPGFYLRFLDKGSSGWYRKSSDGKYYQGDFSVPDTANLGQYKEAPTEVLLDGIGRPVDPNVRVGTGAASVVQTPSGKPVNIDPNQVLRTIGAEGARFMNYWVEDLVDFGPLLAGL